MAIIVTNESSLQGDPTEEAIRKALAGMDLASVQDSTTASRYAVSSVDGANVPTLVGAQVGGNTGTQGGTTVNVIGRDSVQAVTTANLVTVNLLNDALAPGNTSLYSTGPTGTKGWNALSGMLHQTTNILLTTAADGTVTFTLGGAAVGDLSGTYPNPTVVKVNGTALGATSAAAGEVLLGNGTTIASTPISGDAALSGTGALTLAASGVTAGSYGDATHTATFTVDAKGRLTLAGTSAIAFPNHGMQVFIASGNFTVPAGVTTVWVSGCAGGGGGGGSSGGNATEPFTAGGGGGGAGASVIGQAISVTPLAVIPVTIGAGGSGGTAGIANGDGGDGGTSGASSFGSLLTLNGALGGQGGTHAFQSGGSGGFGHPSGGDGMDGQANAMGGSGGSTPFGSGAPYKRGALSSSGGAAGNSTNQYGGGGGGASGAYGNATPTTAGQAGGNGASGIIIVVW